MTIQLLNQLLVGLLAIAVDTVRWVRQYLLVSFRQHGWRSDIPIPLIDLDHLCSDIQSKRRSSRSKCAGEAGCPGASIHVADHPKHSIEVAVALRVDNQWRGVVSKRHFGRFPANFTASAMPHHADRRSQLDQFETLTTALNERQADAFKFTDPLRIHQIAAMATSASEAAEFPKRVGAGFLRILTAWPTQMHDDDAVRFISGIVLGDQLNILLVEPTPKLLGIKKTWWSGTALDVAVIDRQTAPCLQNIAAYSVGAIAILADINVPTQPPREFWLGAHNDFTLIAPAPSRMSVLVPTMLRYGRRIHHFVDDIQTNQSIDQLLVTGTARSKTSIKDQQIAFIEVANVRATTPGHVAISQSAEIGIEVHGAIEQLAGASQVTEKVKILISRESFKCRDKFLVTPLAARMKLHIGLFRNRNIDELLRQRIGRRIPFTVGVISRNSDEYRLHNATLNSTDEMTSLSDWSIRHEKTPAVTAGVKEAV